MKLSRSRPTFALALGLCLGLSTSACKKPEEKPDVAPAAVKPPAAATAPEVAPPSAPARATRPAAPLNVLLLTVDALRADMPWQGYSKPIAPNLTKLAEKSVVYENHRSVSSYTAQSVATLMSGRLASTLYRTGTFFTNYSEANHWISEDMQAKGIRTMAVHAHLYFDRAPGLKQGFDIWKMVPGLTWNSQTDESVTSDKSVDALIELLSNPENTKGQFFLWSHLMDPHDQYIKHEESPDFGKNNRDRYDSEVWFADSHIGRLLDFCSKQPWWEKTAVIVSADHGEAFGDHGMHKHAFEIWEVLTRVPLLVHVPGVTPRRIAAPRTHLDVAPTIVDLMGLPPVEGFQGSTLVPEIYGADAVSREPLLLELAEDSNNPARRAIVVGEYKLISFDGGAKKSLFHLKTDPNEEKDLAATEPGKLAELSKALDEAFTKLPVVAPYGGNKLKSGKLASGPSGPPKTASEPVKTP